MVSGHILPAVISLTQLVLIGGLEQLVPDEGLPSSAPAAAGRKGTAVVDLSQGTIPRISADRSSAKRSGSAHPSEGARISRRHFSQTGGMSGSSSPSSTAPASQNSQTGGLPRSVSQTSTLPASQGPLGSRPIPFIIEYYSHFY